MTNIPDIITALFIFAICMTGLAGYAYGKLAGSPRR